MARKQRSKGTGSIYRKSPKGPWIAAYQDHLGRRRERSTRTTDRATAERILNKLVADTALRREGVIDPRSDRLATASRSSIVDQAKAYIAHCRHAGQAARHISQKEACLAAVVSGQGLSRLADLTADALEAHLQSLKDRGLSARTLNFARQIVVAFFGWCVKTGRTESNPLAVVPKQDEARDRRRIRRPLTPDELSRLVDVARQHGRDTWYLAAALAGLRKGDMQRLTWADVDFEHSTISIRGGKARRHDVVPMHEQLSKVLARRQREQSASSGDRIWPTTVTDRTRLRDFLEAGIARRVPVRGNGVHVKGMRIETRIVAEDEEGRVVDLHALRTTLGTNLARAGVAPQVAKKIMRHSDYRTTEKYYTVLDLVDTAAAIAAMPGITGKPSPAMHHQQFPQQLNCDSEQFSAAQCVERPSNALKVEQLPKQKTPINVGVSVEYSTKRAKGFEPSTFSLGS